MESKEQTSELETNGHAHFNRHIGIDYSGAVTPDSSCKGLRVFMAGGTGTPEQVQPPPSPRRYLPSEVFLGKPHHLVAKQARSQVR
jgi:hypothetical protein